MRAKDIITEKDIINNIIDAWESLRGGECTPRIVERWLCRKMAPAINKARKAVGRKKPSGN